MSRSALLPVLSALLGVCVAGQASVAASPVAHAWGPCDSVPDALSQETSLEGLEGRYRLTLVKTRGVSRPKGVFVGWLYLWRTSERDSSVATGRRAVPNDTTRALYFGTTDVDLDAAEALGGEFWQGKERPTRASVDPVYPPILGHATRGVYEGRPWLHFVLTIGSIANARDGSMGLDGAGVGLHVQRVDLTGLVGYWDAYGIVRTGSGYFCARRAAG